MALKTKSLMKVDAEVRGRAGELAGMLGADRQQIAFASFSRYDITAEALATLDSKTLGGLKTEFGGWLARVQSVAHNGDKTANPVRRDLNALSETKEGEARRDLVETVRDAVPFLAEKFGNDVGAYARLLGALAGSQSAVDALTNFERRGGIRVLADGGKGAFDAFLTKCEARKQPGLNGEKTADAKKKKKSSEWYRAV